MTPTDSAFNDLSRLLDASMLSRRGDRLVASPQTTAEVAAVARYANEQALAVEILGAGTKLAWGYKVETGLVLDTTRLMGVREHVWQDLTTTVAAGTPWSFLQHSLAKQSQRIALDPLWPDTATVGGIVATNDSGALRSRYGSLRDLIIGMTVVLADGTIARTGGKVVKNVAGYDLHKLMTGAFGTLGIITEVTFRLHPIPKSAVTWTAVSGEIAGLEQLRQKIADSSTTFEALQMRTCNGGFALDVALASVPECLDGISHTLHELAAPLTMEETGAEIWSLRERSFVPGKAMVKITSPACRIAGFLAEIRKMGGECVGQQCGIVTAALAADPAPIAALREEASSAGGSLTLLGWPGDDGSRPDVWGPTGSSFPIMQEIKRQFDPHRILNPGRFFGGL